MKRKIRGEIRDPSAFRSGININGDESGREGETREYLLLEYSLRGNTGSREKPSYLLCPLSRHRNFLSERGEILVIEDITQARRYEEDRFSFFCGKSFGEKFLSFFFSFVVRGVRKEYSLPEILD